MPVKKTKKPTPPSEHVWKIRRKADGLFSNGQACYPRFKTEGKSFPTHGKLMLHLHYIKRNMNPKRDHPYLGCEIIQYKLTEEACVDFEGYGE